MVAGSSRTFCQLSLSSSWAVVLHPNRALPLSALGPSAALLRPSLTLKPTYPLVSMKQPWLLVLAGMHLWERRVLQPASHACS